MRSACRRRAGSLQATGGRLARGSHGPRIDTQPVRNLEILVNRQTYRSVLIRASAAFGLAACTMLASTRTAGATIDDSTLNARVKTALIGDERIKARQIDVDTLRGDVQLNGFVDSAAAKT